MMSYINETDFVIENKKLVYPEIVTDGLQLYYDSKGKRDTDYHRDTMLDMSGNKNHGKLYNFAYEKHSGYKDGLVFDYIDDKLVRPTLDLKPDDFTFMLNGNIISFSPDGTVKRVQDGEVIESKGFNLVRNGNVESSYTFETASYINFLKTGDIVGPLNYSNNQSTIPAVSGHEYYVRAIFSKGTVRERLYFVYEGNTANFNNGSTSETDKVSGIITANKTGNANLRLYGSAGEKTKQSIMIIDLTATFGVGNEPTKEQMDEIIQRFGFIPNAQDLIDQVEYKGNTLGDMENIIDGLYKTEVLSGEEIYTDKADDAVVHVDIDGKSYQHAGSGNNLFNKRMLSDRSKFQLATYSSSPVIQLKPNTAYVISASRVNPSPDGNQLVLNVMDATGGVPIYGSQDYNSKRIRSLFNMLPNHVGFNNFTNTFTTRESGLIFFSYYDNHSGKSPEGNWFTDVMIDAQLEEGSVATDYEPPAPTPDYPIEIRSLNDFDVVSSVGGRNYWSIAKKPWFNYLTHQGDGVFTNNTTTSSFAIFQIHKLGVPVGETYTASFEINVSDDAIQFSNDTFYVNGTTPSTKHNKPTLIKDRWVRVQATFNYTVETTGIVHIYISGIPSKDSFQVRNFKLEKGSKATDWSPALEDIIENSNHPLIDKINLLLDEPLRSVGGVKDRLFRDSDGVWKIERNIGVSILNGSETWGEYGTTEFKGNNNVYTISGLLWSKLGYQTSITSHLANKNGIWADGNTDYYSYSDHSTVRTKYFRLPLDVSLSDWKNWLSENPVTFQGQLATPTIETLDQELQDKLNNLRSFEDSNYVYTVLPNENNNISDNLKPTLHAKFLYNNWYKEDRVINNLMIYNRALTNEEMLQNYKTVKRRWGM